MITCIHCVLAQGCPYREQREENWLDSVAVPLTSWVVAYCMYPLCLWSWTSHKLGWFLRGRRVEKIPDVKYCTVKSLWRIFIIESVCFRRWSVFRQHEYLDRTWGEGGAGSTDGEAAPRDWQEDRKSESWGWSEGEPGMGAGDVWGRELESRREGSTLETGGSPLLGGPLWYPPAPVGKKKWKGLIRRA